MAVVVDDNVVRVNISYFLIHVFKFVACSYDVVEQVPHFCFNKVSIKSFPVLDFAVEDIGEIFIGQLNYKILTCT